MLTNSIILAINGGDTLRPLDIWIRPFANSVCDAYYYKCCIGLDPQALSSLSLFYILCVNADLNSNYATYFCTAYTWTQVCLN